MPTWCFLLVGRLLGQGEDAPAKLLGAGAAGRQGDVVPHEGLESAVVEGAAFDSFHNGAGVTCEKRGDVVFEIDGEAALLAVGVPVVGVQVDGDVQQAGFVDDGGVVADDDVGCEQGIELATGNGDDARVVDDLLAHGMRLVNEVEAVEVDGIDERGCSLGLIGGRLLAEGGAVDDGLAPA